MLEACLFLLISCAFCIGDTCESPDSEQHNSIKAMKWKPQNHVETEAG